MKSTQLPIAATTRPPSTPTMTASRMRLDSRARTSARSRRGISKGFPTLAINAITAHQAVDETLQSGRGSASFPSQYVLFAPPTLPPELRRFAHCDRVRLKLVVLHIRSDRNESGAAARSRRPCPQTVNECRARRLSCAVAAKSKSGEGGDVEACSPNQAPADIGENNEANDDQDAADDVAQPGSGHGMGQLGPEPGAAA